MKKQALFVLAGGLLTFAACNNEQAGGYTQEQVDSAVDARLIELQAQMQASNDSIINVMAQWKADSMIAAAKGQAPSTPKPKAPTAPATPTTEPSTPPPPPTIGNGKPKMGDTKEDGTIGNGKPKMGQQENKDEVGNGKPKMGNK